MTTVIHFFDLTLCGWCVRARGLGRGRGCDPFVRKYEPASIPVHVARCGDCGVLANLETWRRLEERAS